MHRQLELWSNSLPCHVDDEVLRGLRFCVEVLAPMGVKAFRTEWEVFGSNVAGSIDWVGRKPDGSLVIVDWKRAKGLCNELTSQYHKKMKAPLQHLDDCAGAKYALQLNCYAYLLENYYGYTVSAMALCCVHEDSSMYTFVPRLDREVAFLMRKRREHVGAQIAVTSYLEEAEPDFPRCALSGDCLHAPLPEAPPYTGRRHKWRSGRTLVDAPGHGARSGAHRRGAVRRLGRGARARRVPQMDQLMPKDGLPEPLPL